MSRGDSNRIDPDLRHRRSVLLPAEEPEGAEISAPSPGPFKVIFEEWQAHFDERAGIREFDGGMPRADAEALALQDTIAALGPCPANERR
jgi:hypothetical protein